jgi:hypothetical protein
VGGYGTLTVAHSSSGSLPDGLGADALKRATYSVNDLGLRHLLALAHNIVLWVFVANLNALPAVLGSDDWSSVGVEGRVGRGGETGLLQQADNLDCNGR